MIRFEYSGPEEDLVRRRILDKTCPVRFEEAIRATSNRCRGGEDWIVSLGSSLLFDVSGLRVLVEAIRRYTGTASELGFRLNLAPETHRDYYSLGPEPDAETRVALPVVARRKSASVPPVREVLDVALKSVSTSLDYPGSLTEPGTAVTPLALLMEYHGEFDLLFANQISIFADLAREVPRSPRAWLKALFVRRPGSWRRRLGLAYSRIHPSADVHPTAVIEGSVIGERARIGAHCVVRYSHVAERAQLFDGAKAELSVVGPGSWLMHDLVLYRSHVEEDVFLIHGPYQFSSFHARSSAFATIMMDYRPDGKPIRAMTRAGVREYGGRFLGAILKEGAKSLGGSLLAPGIIVPRETWMSADPESIHKPGRRERPEGRPVPPSPMAAEPSAGRDKTTHVYWRES